MNVHTNARFCPKSSSTRARTRRIENMREHTYHKRHVRTKKLSLVPRWEASKACRRFWAHPSRTQLAGAAPAVGYMWISRFPAVLNSAEVEKVVWGQNCVLRRQKPALLVASAMTYSSVVSRHSRLSLPLSATWSFSTTASVTLFLVATRAQVKRGSRIAYCALIESEKKNSGRRYRASRGNGVS